MWSPIPFSRWSYGEFWRYVAPEGTFVESKVALQTCRICRSELRQPSGVVEAFQAPSEGEGHQECGTAIRATRFSLHKLFSCNEAIQRPLAGPLDVQHSKGVDAHVGCTVKNKRLAEPASGYETRWSLF